MENKFSSEHVITSSLLGFKKLHPDAQIPKRGTKRSAGFDLYALEDKEITVEETGASLVKTGIAVKLIEGTYGRLALRSGLSVRTGACITAGVIDIDYSGELMVPIVPKVNHPFTIKKGERFAQIIIEYIYTGDAIEITDDLEGDHKGFGSTGEK